MKKLLCFALVCSLLLCSCGNKKWVPETVSSDIKPYAERAIEIIDGYLSFRLSAEEATELMETLAERIEPLDISYANENYTDADAKVAHYITLLSIGDFDRRSDIENMKYRDLLSFALSGKVADKTYPAEAANYGEDFSFNIWGELCFRAKTYSRTESYASINFDYINGVKPLEIYGFVQQLTNTIVSHNVSVPLLFVDYSCYDQLVFSVMVSFKGEKPIFVVYYQDENIDCNSLEEVNKTLKNLSNKFPHK